MARRRKGEVRQRHGTRKLILKVFAEAGPSASLSTAAVSERDRVAMQAIRAGRRATRAGRPPGRPVGVTPEKEAAILRLHADGLSWRAVAQRVGLPRGTCANVASRARRGRLHSPVVPNRSGGTPEGPPLT